MIDLLLTAVVSGVVGFVAGAFTVAIARRGARLAATAGGPALPTAGGRGDDLLSASIRDVRKGGLVQVSNLGDAGEDVDLEVERYDRHVAGRDEWHVLDGTYAGRHVGLEWQEVRGALRLWAHKELRRLAPEQVGLGDAALAALAPGKEHAHDGTSYVVETAGKALRHENGTGFGREHEAWRLVSRDGKRVLHVERWSGKPATATLGEVLDPEALTIYRVKA